MKTKMLSPLDKNRIGIDQVIFQNSFLLSNAFKSKQRLEDLLKDRSITLIDKGNSLIATRKFRLNGHVYAKSILSTELNESVDEDGDAGMNNFIGVKYLDAVSARPELWRTHVVDRLAEAVEIEVFNMTQTLRSVWPHVTHLGSSVYSMEVVLDVLLPVGIEAATDREIRKAFDKNFVTSKHALLTGVAGESRLVALADEVDDRGTRYIVGKFASGAKGKGYIKQRTMTGWLNRFELTVEGRKAWSKPDKIMASFKSASELREKFDALKDIWFDYLTDCLQLDLSKSIARSRRMVLGLMRVLHPNHADVIAGYIMKFDKVNIHQPYVMVHRLRAAAKLGYFYKLSPRSRDYLFNWEKIMNEHDSAHPSSLEEESIEMNDLVCH